MTKRQFCVELADRTGIDLKTAMSVFEAHEDLVMEIIATEDSINFSWAKIFGYFREPRKMNSYLINQNQTLKINGGWALAKSGMPGIEWTDEAKAYTPINPTEFFCEWDEVKFTTKAREYRQDRNLPEIPEYDGLPEKMIQSLMKKADEKRYGKRTKRQIQEETRDRLIRARNSAARYHIIRLEWIDEQVRKGVPRAEAEKVKLAQILEEKRKEWQTAIEYWENNNKTATKKIKGKLNPYEIYKENSMADYYQRLMKDGDFEDEEMLTLMKMDVASMPNDIEEFEEEESEANAIYDDDGYRIDKDGDRIEYWQSLDVIYRHKNSDRKKARRKKLNKQIEEDKAIQAMKKAEESENQESEETQKIQENNEDLGES